MRCLPFFILWLLLPERLAFSAEPLLPLPSPPEVSLAKAELGERLFHDTRLSGHGRLSCASCHHLDSGGDDGLPLSPVPTGPHPHNTPTIFNSVFNFRLHWYGDLNTLQEQAQVALQRDMEVDWRLVLERLRVDHYYSRQFNSLYGGLDANGIIDALVTFERTLVTPDAPIDRFLKGYTDALTLGQHQGYRLFKRYGCSACHQGINIGGNLFQKLGVFGDYDTSDPGRYAVTGRMEDLRVFRVPSLRNVAVTAPYFHDGRVKTLEKAVALMAEYQLGIRLSKKEIVLIVDFLHSLTGRYRGRYLDIAP